MILGKCVGFETLESGITKDLGNAMQIRGEIT